MKRILSLTLTLLFIMSALFVLPASAESAKKTTDDGLFEYKVMEDDNIALTDYLGTATKVVFPDSVDEKKVTKVIVKVFKKSFTNVTINKYINGLSGKHFVGKDNLIKINVNKNNKNYTSVNGALYNKDKTKLIAYPAGKTELKFSSKIRNIGKKALSKNQNIKSVTIPNTVKKINDDAFANCVKLKKVVIPDSLTYLGSGVFCKCTALTSISFKGNKNLSLGGENGGDVFAYCKSLKTAVYPISNATKAYDGAGMFIGCTKLEKVTIPSDVKIIANYAYEECDNLKSITIPASVTKIGTMAIGYIEGNYTPTVNKNFIIKGKKGTEAEKYAKKNGLKFKEIK